MTSALATRIQLSYRDDLQLLVGRWLTDATLEEFRAEYGAVLAAAQQHEAWRWLLDIRRRPLPPAGALEWLSQLLLPQAAQAAPRQLCVAYLVSPQRMQAVAADQQLQAAAAALQAGQPTAQVQMFMNEGEAIGWLTDCPR